MRTEHARYHLSIPHMTLSDVIGEFNFSSRNISTDLEAILGRHARQSAQKKCQFSQISCYRTILIYEAVIFTEP